MKAKYSVIVPCYNEQEVLEETNRRLTRVLETLDGAWEILYVNDGSTDRTASILEDLCSRDRRIKAIFFARNRGHQIAVTAGLEHATGDAVVIIDADLQDPPELIPDMVALWKQGAKVVFGKRRRRAGESRFKKWTASVYYKIINALTGGMIPRDTGDFRLADRAVVEAIKRMPEHDRFLRGMFAWVGFEQVPLEYDREGRFAGQTHYPLKKMLRLALDGIFGFSSKPLKLATWTGAFWTGAGLLCGLILLILLCAGVQGGLWWLAALMMVLGGNLLIAIGIAGEYIARIFDETRGRPLYIAQKMIGLDE